MVIEADEAGATEKRGMPVRSTRLSSKPPAVHLDSTVCSPDDVSQSGLTSHLNL